MIRIKNEHLIGNAASITTADGTPIDGVRSLSIRIAVDEVVTADVDLMVGAVDVLAHPLLTLDSLIEAARAHGYTLIKSD